MIIESFVNKWVVLIGEKNIEDSIKDGLIITATTTGIFFCSHDSQYKTTNSISRRRGYHKIHWWNSGGVLIKDYVAYEKWINK